MKNCLFCKIVNKEINADIVKEYQHVIAFKDINPIAPNHILIIPKIHISSLNNLKENDYYLMGEMTKTANDISKNILKDIDGSRLIINNGKNGGQTVFHIHLHLLSGRKFGWPPG